MEWFAIDWTWTCSLQDQVNKGPRFVAFSVIAIVQCKIEQHGNGSIGQGRCRCWHWHWHCACALRFEAFIHAHAHMQLKMYNTNHHNVKPHPSRHWRYTPHSTVDRNWNTVHINTDCHFPKQKHFAFPSFLVWSVACWQTHIAACFILHLAHKLPWY